jgi:hypothetical protein
MMRERDDERIGLSLHDNDVKRKTLEAEALHAPSASRQRYGSQRHNSFLEEIECGIDCSLKICAEPGLLPLIPCRRLQGFLRSFRVEAERAH